jgi:hypothetical protein
MDDKRQVSDLEETHQERADFLQHRLNEVERELADLKRTERLLRIRIEMAKEYIEKMADCIK